MHLIFSLNFFLLFSSRCDSFGNRPVTAPTGSHRGRPVTFGSGRIRSGSMGNKTQIASTGGGGGGRGGYGSRDAHYFAGGSSGGLSRAEARIEMNNHFLIRKANFNKDNSGKVAAAAAAVPTANAVSKKINADIKTTTHTNPATAAEE